MNLIGEHIDYEGYGVLPMAIEQDTVVAIATSNDRTLSISNVDAAKYPKATFSSDPSHEVGTGIACGGNAWHVQVHPISHAVAFFVIIAGHLIVLQHIHAS